MLDPQFLDFIFIQTHPIDILHNTVAINFLWRDLLLRRVGGVRRLNWRLQRATKMDGICIK